MGELVFVGLDGGVVAPDQSGCLPVVFEIWGAAGLSGKPNPPAALHRKNHMCAA